MSWGFRRRGKTTPPSFPRPQEDAVEPLNTEDAPKEEDPEVQAIRALVEEAARLHISLPCVTNLSTLVREVEKAQAEEASAQAEADSATD